MLEIFAAFLGLAVFVIAGYGLWRISKQGLPKPPR
jgi:hypothetical protein